MVVSKKVLHLILGRILFFGVAVLLPALSLAGKRSEQAREELEFGTVLYEFYQGDYFNALINFEYVLGKNNSEAASDHGRLLKGGMLLSYGVPNESHTIFNDILDSTESELSRNSAWYYLAKLFYSKSDLSQAKSALSHVKGKVTQGIHIDYHYLSTLIGDDGKHLKSSRNILEEIQEDLPQYPYFLFNFAIRSLNEGDVDEAIKRLTQVTHYRHLSEEHEVLSDRAKHGLSQIANRQGQLDLAWENLSSIRTTGLYSNRALLSYAWAAIKLKRFEDAIPALQILDSRSIALPEVQEAKVLLAHLYEQSGAKRKALKQNVIAEKEFQRGLSLVGKARSVIEMQDVPREFIGNLEKVVRETDWYGERPEVDYQSLTPFLIDLLSSNGFNEALKELADLYAIENNLNYWLRQGEQHLIILNENENKYFNDEARAYINSSEKLGVEFAAKETELSLLLLSLEEGNQERFVSLITSTREELEKLSGKIAVLGSVEKHYEVPEGLAQEVTQKQGAIAEQLKVTHYYIAAMERVVRRLVNIELDKHSSRMSYYSAQARLAKARLYDATLFDLENARQRVQSSEGL